MVPTTNFLLLIFYSIVISFSYVGYGKIFLKICKIDFKDYNLGYLGLIGSFLLILISFASSFFFKHGYIHNIIILVLGLVFFLKFFLWEKIKEYKLLILIFFTTLSFFLISKTHDDFSYYHLPFSLNLSENPIQFGLGNLNLAYRHHSSILFLNSLSYLPGVKFYLFNLPNYLFLIFVNFIFIKEIFKKENKFFLLLFSLFFFTLINIKFSRLSEYGTDLAGQIIVSVIFLNFLKIFYYNKFNLKNYFLIIIFFLLVFSFKAYFATYFILILIMFYNLKNKTEFHIKNFSALFYSLLILFISLNFLHSFISTGCLIYPIKFSCVGSYYDWTLTKFEIDRMNIWLELWAKAGAGPGFQEDDKINYISNFNWLANWFNIYFFNKVSDYILILFSISLILLFIFRDNFNLIDFNFKKITIFLPIIIIFLLWFVKHPSLRYGGYIATGLLFFLVNMFLFKENINGKVKYLKKIKYLILIIFFIFNLKNIIRINAEFKTDNEFKFTNFPLFFVKENKYEKYIENNVTVYLINSGSCWATPTPCSRAITSIKIKNGFVFINR